MFDGYPLRKYNWKDWLWMIIGSSLFLQVVMVIILSYLIAAMVSNPTLETLAEASFYGSVYGTILSLPVTLLVVYLRKIPLFNRKQLSKEESFIIRGLTKEDWNFLVKYIPVSYILYIIGSVIVGSLFGVSEATNQVAIESLFDYVPAWVMFIMVVIVAPIVEELLFRGIMLFPGGRLETTWLRLIISTVLFAVVHGPSDVYTTYTYLGMSVMFAYASKRTQTVEAPIVYHTLNNLMGFIAIMSI